VNEYHSGDRAFIPDGRGHEWANPGATDVSVDCAGAQTAVHYVMDHTDDVVSFSAVQREPYTRGGWTAGLHRGLKVFDTPSRTPVAGKTARMSVLVRERLLGNAQQSW